MAVRYTQLRTLFGRYAEALEKLFTLAPWNSIDEFRVEFAMRITLRTVDFTRHSYNIRRNCYGNRREI